MRDPATYTSYLGQGQYYIDFLIHFQSEIEQKGWKVVLNECVFSNDERGDDMLVRLFAGRYQFCTIS